MRYFWMTIFTLIFFQTQAQQSAEAEQFRQAGYEAKEQGDLSGAIENYEKVLQLIPDDYDACLALARLYFQTEQYDRSGKCYRRMLDWDAADVEALHGLGKVMLYTDRYDEAETYLKKALELQPDYLAPYFDLAKVYSWSGNLDKAIDTYRRILEYDDTYAEAWQGLGKMYYWKEKPFDALVYYGKALKWDPANEEIRNEYEEILRETRWTLTDWVKYVSENEESYNVDALSNRISVEKRLTNLLAMDFSLTGDRAGRIYYIPGATNELRHYADAKLTLHFIFPNHRISLYGGYAPTDERPSAYGVRWKGNFHVKQISFEVMTDAGYEYFYYWNYMGQKRLNQSVKTKYNRWEWTVEARAGIVDTAFVVDVPGDRYETDENPFHGFGTGISYRLLNKPLLKAGVSYDYLTYSYKSPRYYSPLGRQTGGADVSIYYPAGKFYLYSSVRVHAGREYYWESTPLEDGTNALNKIYIPSHYGSFNLELGYRYGNWEWALTGSSFKTPYYTNITAGVSAKYFFGL